jgi:hypothetical protein
VKQAINLTAILPHTPHAHDVWLAQLQCMGFDTLFLRNKVSLGTRKLDECL